MFEKRILSFASFTLAASLLMGGCSNPGTTSVGNPALKVTFGKLASGGSQIKVPVAVVTKKPSALRLKSVTPDLDQASIDVFKNGVSSSVIDPAASFDATNDSVVFNLESVTPGDTISLVIHSTEGGSEVYSAVLSADAGKDRSAIDCDATTNAAEKIVCSICTEMTTCFSSLATPTCLAALTSSDQVQLDDELGVPVDENALSMQGVVEGVEIGTFVAEAAFLGECLTDLNALTCQEVSTGYDPNFPEEFNNVENFIPGQDIASCGEVFGD